MAQLKSKQLTYPLSGSFTGSLYGTASYAITASYAMNGGGGGGTPGGNLYEIQYNNGTFEGVPVLTYSGSVLRATGSFSGSFTGLIDSASYAATASYAPDYLLLTETGSISVLSSSYASTASLATTASYALTASYVVTAQTASYVLQAVSSSYSLSSSYSVSSSYAESSSYSITASYALSSSYSISSSIATTASYITSSNVYGPHGSDSVISSSYALTASYALTSAGGGSGAGFPFTGSAVITGSLIVTGSATFTDSIIVDSTLVTSSIITTTGASPETVFTQATGSYRSMFVKYIVSETANARAGEFMAVWNEGSIKYTDTSTTDIGDTSAVVLDGIISGDTVQLQTSPGAGWTVKTQTTFI